MGATSVPACAAAATPPPAEPVPHGSVSLPAKVPLFTFSKAAGPWSVDWKRAQADARAVLASIDFSKPEVVIWVPGTDAKSVHPDFALAVRYLGNANTSLTFMRYEASWHMRRSLPTGLATMKLVLEGIKQRLAEMPAASRPRILLAGESQGAWIIGEAAADPRVGSVISRAALMGHPWLAAHQYADGQDPRIWTINHKMDQISMPVAGDAGVGMDAMTAVRTGQLFTGKNLATVIKAIAANPIHGVLLLHTRLREVPWLKPLLNDPHKYTMEMARMVKFLRTGAKDSTAEEIEQGRKPGEPPGGRV